MTIFFIIVDFFLILAGFGKTRQKSRVNVRWFNLKSEMILKIRRISNRRTITTTTISTQQLKHYNDTVLRKIIFTAQYELQRNPPHRRPP